MLARGGKSTTYQAHPEARFHVLLPVAPSSRKNFVMAHAEKDLLKLVDDAHLLVIRASTIAASENIPVWKEIEQARKKLAIVTAKLKAKNGKRPNLAGGRS